MRNLQRDTPIVKPYRAPTLPSVWLPDLLGSILIHLALAGLAIAMHLKVTPEPLEQVEVPIDILLLPPDSPSPPEQLPAEPQRSSTIVPEQVADLAPSASTTIEPPTTDVAPSVQAPPVQIPAPLPTLGDIPLNQTPQAPPSQPLNQPAPAPVAPPTQPVEPPPSPIARGVPLNPPLPNPALPTGVPTPRPTPIPSGPATSSEALPAVPDVEEDQPSIGETPTDSLGATPPANTPLPSQALQVVVVFESVGGANAANMSTPLAAQAYPPDVQQALGQPVLLDVVINPQGRVDSNQVQVLKSGGSDRYDQLAIQSMLQLLKDLDLSTQVVKQFTLTVTLQLIQPPPPQAQTPSSQP